MPVGEESEASDYVLREKRGWRDSRKLEHIRTKRDDDELSGFGLKGRKEGRSGVAS